MGLGCLSPAPLPISLSWFMGNSGFALGFDQPLEAAGLEPANWTAYRNGKLFEFASVDADGSSVIATGTLTATPAPSDHIEYAGGDSKLRGASGVLVAPFGYP